MPDTSLFHSLQSRTAHNIDLKGTVIIFDEAHNVVSVRPQHQLPAASLAPAPWPIPTICPEP